jgi:hypothetical protein
MYCPTCFHDLEDDLDVTKPGLTCPFCGSQLTLEEIVDLSQSDESILGVPQRVYRDVVAVLTQIPVFIS